MERVFIPLYGWPWIACGLSMCRYSVSKVLDMAYWGFLGTIDPVFFVVFGECKHRYAISSLMDTAYWLSE
ncbi:hypothetical protein Tco_0025651 [Tanacetum coccineum]